MSPIIIFFGDMYFISLATQVFSTCLFLFLLYVDKKMPEIITQMWLFIIVQLVFTSLQILCFATTIPVTGSFFDIPFFLNNIFSFSSILLASAIAYLKTSHKSFLFMLSISSVLIILIQIMLTISLQI